MAQLFETIFVCSFAACLVGAAISSLVAHHKRGGSFFDGLFVFDSPWTYTEIGPTTKKWFIGFIGMAMAIFLASALLHIYQRPA
ncbi:MAG TPA: hypothetical protein VG125_17285 [Pirellulales bacterium]|jgi:hypothetical protein|nr:hypothetical protein [Pirellulales bacterium]